MISLFSVFDPTSYLGIYLNFIILFLVIIYYPIKYYIIERGYYRVWTIISGELNKIFNEVSSPNYRGIVFICVVTFLYLVIRNIIGLFPFVFTSTAHPVITIGLGLVFWITFFLIGWRKRFYISAAHLVPEGRPLFLAPLIVLIERVRHLIRPFTLSIRLAANMIAGHLIVGLLSIIRKLRIFGFSSSLFLQSILLVLEFGVSVIQGFVFRILILLYALEYY